KEKQLPTFAKQTAILLLAVFLGIAANAPRLMAMKEYADHSTRGSSELTIYPDGSPKVASTGLDYGYITEYSYAKLETFNLFIPRFMGGGTFEKLDENSAFYQLISEKAGRKVADDYSERVLTYWGDQTIIEAPAYIGAVLFFLFFLGIFLVKGKLKQWLVAATIFSILMSWGRNFELLTHFFIDYVPLYNKFRAVSSIQVIAELCVPILSFLALKAFFSKAHTLEEKQEALKKAVYVFVGLVFVGFISAHMFATFEGLRDQQKYNALPGLIDALITDRKAMLLTDTLRSLILTGVAAGTLWLLLKNTLKQTAVIIVFAVLLLFDLISIDKRYVNEADFNPARNIENPFVKTNADKLIQQDTTHYRVGNFTVDPMIDARTSYFHNSIGGYHAAKMGRYQELFEYQIAQRNMGVLDMLNTKYFLFSDDQGATQVQLNEAANGNAWFVENLKLVTSANEVMQALDSLDSKTTAVLNRKDFETQFIANETLQYEKDSTATIQLKNYDVTTLTYHSNTQKEQFAVFSEIYYKEGWNAYIDGDLTPHFRVNYVLRGMKIPAGAHEIVFQFEPSVIKNGRMISLIAYGLLLLFPIGWFFYEKKGVK
ncbi:YfhO family protein, partial [Polaribacter sp.]|nr:YfhO family protein [Polaribacter sp.]